MRREKSKRIIKNLLALHIQEVTNRAPKMDAIECEKRVKQIEYLKRRNNERR